MNPSIGWYEAHAREAAERYERADSARLHAWVEDFLPQERAAVLDVGAGSGRDAAWLASKGHDVVAIEPAAAMRKEARRRHPQANIQWQSDRLPELQTITRTGLSFDFILLSAVWMHVAPQSRRRAFRKLTNLLKPGGALAISLRHGPAEPGRGMHEAAPEEIEKLAREHGAFVAFREESGDLLGRNDVRWTQLVVRLPGDSTGALPLIRHAILNDNKSSTYKLALLRCLCRIADGMAGIVRDHSDEFVSIPLGLVALTWLRLFKPLLQADLPQSPRNTSGGEKLGFVKEAYARLAKVSALDLRVGTHLRNAGEAIALHKALRDAVNTITEMPATYLTYPDGRPILPVQRAKRRQVTRAGPFQLDANYLRSFGEMLVPRHIWQTLQRLDVWIEPALVAEWKSLMKLYAIRQDRKQQVNDSRLEKALRWAEQTRDVSLARRQALELLENQPLYCVWSGKKLTGNNLDIDHCLPWAAWPCGDLWNLMPAHRNVNQHQKKDRLPGASLLRTVQDRVMGWWERAYDRHQSPMQDRFWLEADASLPGMLLTGQHTLDDVFEAVCVQRMKLKHDQQVPEWDGNR